jgi:hypothetical protein
MLKKMLKGKGANTIGIIGGGGGGGWARFDLGRERGWGEVSIREAEMQKQA